MKLDDRTEMTRGEITREEMLRAAAGRRKRRRRSNVRAVMTLLGLLILFAAAIYGGMTLYTDWKEEQQAEPVDNQEPVVVEESVAVQEPLYTEEQLNEKIAEAVSAAASQEQEAGASRVLEGIKEALTAGNTTVETLRPYYPDEIVVVSAGSFHFVPINRGLKQNDLVRENLNILESGEYQYLTDGAVTSHKGIDVSNHQGKIDWQQVAADGVEFAIIRAAFRGYGTGKLVEDEMFETNIEGAKAAGIKVGVYLFSQAVTEEEVLEEANLVLEKIAPYQLDCPVVFDVEKVSGTGRMNALSVEERTALTELFCQTVQNAGYRPMIYYNTEMAALMLNLTELEEYDKWYASYSEQMFFPYEYKIWQYSDKGKVQGISGAVDMNISFAPLWE